MGKIAKRSVIQEKIKKIEIKKNFNNPKIPEKFIEQILQNVYSKIGFANLEDFKKYLISNNIDFENVKNIRGHDGGKTAKVITKSLRDLGYSVFWNVFNKPTFFNILGAPYSVIALSNALCRLRTFKVLISLYPCFPNSPFFNIIFLNTVFLLDLSKIHLFVF